MTTEIRKNANHSEISLTRVHEHWVWDPPKVWGTARRPEMRGKRRPRKSGVHLKPFMSRALFLEVSISRLFV